MKKLFTFIFGISLIVNAFGQATNGTCGIGLSWSLSGGKDNRTLTISGTGNMYDYGISAPWTYYSAEITNIEIKNGVTSIGNGAFQYCSNLPFLILPESITKIGYSAFMSCTALSSINIPSGITIIESQTFLVCNSLTSISLPNGLTTIEGYAFYGTGLTSITIPENVTRLGSYAFADCPNLKTVNYNAVNCVDFGDLDKINNNPYFYLANSGFPFQWVGQTNHSECNITTVNIGNNVKIIPDFAFMNSKITEITIPESVTYIGYAAFGNSNLTKVNYNAINNSTFGSYINY